MNVMDIMTRNVVTIHKTDTLATAIEAMEQFNTRHLVVIEANCDLVGIVSDRDCKLSSQSPFMAYDAETAQAHAREILVERLMTADPEWIDPRASVEEAATVMVDKRISCLPVIHDKQVIGIITSTDLLKVLAARQDA